MHPPSRLLRLLQLVNRAPAPPALEERGWRHRPLCPLGKRYSAGRWTLLFLLVGQSACLSVGRSARALMACAALTGSVGACSSGHGSASSPTSSPASFETLIDAGRLLLQQGNTNAAQQLFEQAINRSPDMPVGYYDLGVVYQQEGQTAQALQSYRQAVGDNHSYVPALYNEAVIVTDSNASQAMALYRKIIAIQPDAPTALLNLGLLEATANQTADAVSDVRQAVKLEPSLASRVPASLKAKVPAS